MNKKNFVKVGRTSGLRKLVGLVGLGALAYYLLEKEKIGKPAEQPVYTPESMNPEDIIDVQPHQD